MKNIKTLTLHFILLFAVSSFGKQQIFISYRETLAGKLQFSDEQLKTINWQVEGDSQLRRGGGETINSFVYAVPGTYILKITPNKIVTHNHIDACDHMSPMEFEVVVSQLKIKFLFDELQLSSKILGNVALADNVTLQVPVLVETYDNKPITYNGFIKSSGIKTTIEGQLVDNSVTISPGKNILKYNLSGMATKETYIMLDFHTEDQEIQAYSLTYKIN